MFEKVKEDAGRSVSEYIETDRPSRKNLVFASIGFSINLLAWAVAFLVPEGIASWVGLAADISDKLQAYLLAVPFWSSFLCVFSLLRIRQYRNPVVNIQEGSMFGSYRDSEKSGYLRRLTLIALAAAGVNTILLAALLISVR